MHVDGFLHFAQCVFGLWLFVILLRRLLLGHLGPLGGRQFRVVILLLLLLR